MLAEDAREVAIDGKVIPFHDIADQPDENDRKEASFVGGWAHFRKEVYCLINSPNEAVTVVDKGVVPFMDLMTLPESPTTK